MRFADRPASPVRSGRDLVGGAFTPSKQARRAPSPQQRMRQARHAARLDAARRGPAGMLDDDAFALTVAAAAEQQGPPVTDAAARRVAAAMRSAPIHRVHSLDDFVATVGQFEAAVASGSAADRLRFRQHHADNMRRFGLTGQTVDSGRRIVLFVGVAALRSAEDHVIRHERGHVGLTFLGVPVARHHPIMDALGLGGADVPHLGIPVGV